MLVLAFNLASAEDNPSIETNRKLVCVDKQLTVTTKRTGATLTNTRQFQPIGITLLERGGECVFAARYALYIV